MLYDLNLILVKVKNISKICLAVLSAIVRRRRHRTSSSLLGSKSVTTKSMSEKTFSSLKKNEAGKERKNYQRSKDQFVETNKLDHRTRIQLGRSPSWTSQLGERPRLTQHGFSLAVHRAGPKMDSARPFAELDPTRIQLGRRAGPVQFGKRPSWTQDRFGSAVRQVGPVQFGERSSWIDRNPSSPRPHNSSPEIALNSFLFRLDWRHRQNFTI